MRHLQLVAAGRVCFSGLLTNVVDSVVCFERNTTSHVQNRTPHAQYLLSVGGPKTSRLQARCPQKQR